MVMEAVEVRYQQQLIGALSFNTETGVAAFEYTPAFIRSGVQLSPLKMPLSRRIFSFPELDFNTFKGLPGLIADSLPDDFGNAVLNAWVAAQGRSPQDISPLQRLQYIGKRGMGALEFAPATRMRQLNASQAVAIDELVTIAQDILDARHKFSVTLPSNGDADREAMLALLSVGTSAGGARPKAVLAFNDDFSQVRSGQVSVPDGFTHYLLKFDGVTESHSSQQTFGDPLGYGAMEYVYYLLARDCGIDMEFCRLLPEGSRRHFLTRRFDRVGNKKVHVQTLNGLAHVDYKKPGSFSYEEVFDVARQLKLPAHDFDQILRRLVFNIVARNHDDHAKNIAFVMNESGQWRLAPAYDMAYSYKPGSAWVAQHWMRLNGKRDNFVRADIYSLERQSPLFSRSYLDDIISATLNVVGQWPRVAREWDVPPALIDEIAHALRGRHLS